MVKRLKLGATVGCWKILTNAGAGGNAEIFKVESLDGSQSGALKVLHRKSEEATARFKREIETAAKIPQHTNVIKVLDSCFKAEGSYDELWLVMEWIGGGNLRNDRGSYIGALEKTYKSMAQAADGVSWLHSHGILHRDLKPDNILIRDSGDMVVSDLGLCWLTEFREARLTPEGRATGAWGFRAPEHEHSRVDEVSMSADVFSLVKMTWWLIFGGDPFASAHYQSEAFDLVKKFNDVRMSTVMHLLSKVMVADPSNREIQTAEALAEHLRSTLKMLQKPHSDLVSIARGRLDARANAQARLEKAQKIEARLNEKLPSLLEEWAISLRGICAVINEDLEARGDHHLLIVSTSTPSPAISNVGKISCQYNGLAFSLRYERALVIAERYYRLSGFTTAWIINGNTDVTDRPLFGGSLRLVPVLLGDDSATFFIDGDSSGIPADATIFWSEAIEKLLQLAP